ncbi:MAG: type II toxin-antitoxin system VapC family toxin [Verrucomicrobia bacterium]|nr:type II toxin-antitoxin system VapC family toxin [Leptolyngbya sp. ES-bin-22]
MKGIDTNILVRYLVRDDLKQFEKAEQILSQRPESQEVCLVNHVVLCETFWVLKSIYSYERYRLVETLEFLLNSQPFEFESRTIVERALEDFQRSKADFSDCLLNQINKIIGCTETYTFDRATERLDGFTVLVGA